MKFDEDKALQIINTFDLDEHTLAVWKTRGKIPDRYFKDDYQKPEDLKDQVHDKLLTILESEKLNIKAIAERSGIAYQKFQDVQADRSSFSAQEYTAIKVALNTLRIDAKKHVETYTSKGRVTEREVELFKKFLKNNREIVISHVFKNKRMRDWKSGKVTLQPEEYRNAMDELSIFVLETSLPEK